MDKKQWPGVIAAYRKYIPLDPSAKIITLNEGNTPLIQADRTAQEIAPGRGLKLYLKYEGLNPTGSFKDRGMCVAITQAVFEGADTVVCASTGNTAASAAAYSARAGLRCLVLVPAGQIAQGKLAAALAHGAEVVSISGSFDDGLAIIREIAHKQPVALVNSVNPWRLEGQKTAAFEICDWLDNSAPDWLCLPIGNAGNVTAYWMGFRQLGRGLPRFLGAQAAGSAPLVLGRAVEKPDTIASAIRIGNPARWKEAIEAIEGSNGNVVAVTDKQILESWKMLAEMEGIFVEPASAAGLAALHQEINLGNIDPGDKIICVVLTGHGLKDPVTALAQAKEVIELPGTVEAITSYLDS